MVDTKGQRLSHLHWRNSDLCIEHDQADGSTNIDEVRFELGHSSREEKLHIGAGRRGLADLQIELQVVDSSEGIGVVDLDGQQIALVIARKPLVLCAELNGLLTVRPPPPQRLRLIGPGRHGPAEIAMDQRSVGPFSDLDDGVTPMHPKGHDL